MWMVMVVSSWLQAILSHTLGNDVEGGRRRHHLQRPFSDVANEIISKETRPTLQ